METDDDKRIEKLEKQVDQREESLHLRIEGFDLERHLIEARQQGEDVQELEAELQKVRKALRELNGRSKLSIGNNLIGQRHSSLESRL